MMSHWLIAADSLSVIVCIIPMIKSAAFISK